MNLILVQVEHQFRKNLKNCSSSAGITVHHKPESLFTLRQNQCSDWARICIRLITSYDDDTDVQKMSENLSELKQSLLEMDIELELKVNEHMHDREIRIDNGWTVKIGRGLDFFQKPDSWFGVGANDLNLRKCLETKVDIFRR